METKQNPTGSGEPQAIEQILENYFATSSEPLAAAFRTQHAESYQKNEIYIGDRLILTFETEQSVLNSKIIEGLVEKYLLS